MAKKNLSKQKKMDTRVNFTPMVDMMMLLITFFMLCTTLAKPQAMQLTMPSNDKENLDEKDKQVTKASHTITLYLGENNKVWYVAGLPNYEDPASCVKETTYGKDGIEKVLIEHTTEEGINPVAKIKLAKKELDAKKSEYNSKMTDEQYQEQLRKLKKGELPNGEKVPTLTCIIRPLPSATYANMVAALDEMLISNIDKYVIDDVDKMSEEDKQLIEKAGVK
jgi:biopolymer transport protein ExbD